MSLNAVLFLAAVGLTIALLVRRALLAEERSPALLTVLEAGDPGVLATAKAALDAAGIHYVVEGEQLQNLFGLGRLGTGYNKITGPPRIRVPESQVARAREILEDYRE